MQTAKCLTEEKQELYLALDSAKLNEDNRVKKGRIGEEERCKLDGTEIFSLSYVHDGSVTLEQINKAYDCLLKRCEMAGGWLSTDIYNFIVSVQTKFPFSQNGKID